MVELRDSAARKTDNQWRQIRRTETSLKEVRACDAFAKGAQFVGQELPVTMGEETVEHIEMLLTDELMRLKTLSAT